MTTAPYLLAAALDAAERGWHVFPLLPNAKRPAFPDHPEARCTRRDPRCRHGHQGWEPRATTDPTRIRRAWTLAPFNIGIATGPSGLLVIDLDTMKTPHDEPPAEWQHNNIASGTDVLAALAERAGQPVPTDTYTVATGRGGQHLYFTPPPGARYGNTAGRLGWLIDTRAHGGYVVAAGSTVNARPYRTVTDAPTAPLPLWLANALAPTGAEQVGPTRGVQELLASAQRRGGYVGAALRGETTRVLTAGSHRNDALNTAAYSLGRLIGAGVLDRDTAEEALTAAALAAGLGQDPRQPGEIPRTIRSGLDAGIRHPRRVPA